MLRGFLIAVALIAGCVTLALASLGKQSDAIEKECEAMAVTPPWSPYATNDAIPELGIFGRYAAESFDLDAADAVPLNSGRYSRYVYPSSPCS